jgi:hypothetical protein
MVNFMTNRKQLQKEIAELIFSQKLAVLATQSHEGSSYASRKFANIEHNPKVSLLIDDRSNNEKDFHDAQAVTVMGVVGRIESNSTQSELSQLYLSKHPYLEEFLCSPSTAFIVVSVKSYFLVSRFQEVMELHIRNENDIPAI